MRGNGLSKENDRINEIYVTGGENSALRAWKKLASKGDVEAMSYLGAAYFEDIGDYKESARWYEEASAKGDVESNYYLAFAYKELGLLEKAEKSFIESINNQIDDAVIDLAKLYLEHMAKPAKALELVTFHAQKGQKDAKLFLIDLLLQQEKVDGATFWIENIRERGNSSDVASLLRTLRRNNNESLAKEILVETAEKGSISAQEELLISMETNESEESLKLILEDFISKFNKRHIYSLANSLDQGDFAHKRSYSRSAEYLFSSLAIGGHKNSLLRLGNVILRDPSADRSEEALPWLIKASESGSRPAQVALCDVALKLGHIDVFEKWFDIALAKGLTGQNHQFGIQLERSGHLEEALQAYKNDYESGYQRAGPDYYFALWQTGRRTEAQILENEFDSHDFSTFITVADRFRQNRDFKQSISWLLRADPENSINVSTALSYCYWKIGDLTNSKKYLLIAEEQRLPEFAETHPLTFGKMWFRLGNPEKALSFLQLGSQENWALPHFEILGVVLFELGDLPRVYELWSIAQGLGSSIVLECPNWSVGTGAANSRDIDKISSAIKSKYDL